MDLLIQKQAMRGSGEMMGAHTDTLGACSSWLSFMFLPLFPEQAANAA